MADPSITTFFDDATNTATHLVACPATGRAAIIDSVLDYDHRAGRVATRSADALIEQVRGLGLAVDWILETHAHADHLSAAPYLQRQLGGTIAIGRMIATVQRAFRVIYNTVDADLDGASFGRLFDDGDVFRIGELDCRVMHTPGHTPACVSYLIGGHAFVGDTLFMPDYGTARCDFPGGDARALYRSIRRLLALPPDTTLHLCHDYPPASRSACWQVTVAEQRAHNIHIHEAVAEDAFVAMRTARDRTLAMPVLILPSVQVNLNAGRLPPPEANGIRYLRIPLDAL
ncbi:MAG: MBL fold metallo-hydrolase [Lautropia sp.]